jgi:hypothetical protein
MARTQAEIVPQAFAAGHSRPLWPNTVMQFRFAAVGNRERRLQDLWVLGEIDRACTPVKCETISSSGNLVRLSTSSGGTRSGVSVVASILV